MDLIDWGRIENFIGYGRRDAPVVFVGMEEGLGGGKKGESATEMNDRLVADLIKRSNYENVRDLEAPTAIVKCWRPMCEIMLRRDGFFPSADTRIAYRERIREYQATRLGKEQGDTLLMELLPYPRPSMAVWPDAYKERGYENAKQYRERFLERRIKALKSVLLSFDRELVVFYGIGYTSQYKKFFEDKWCEKLGYQVANSGNTMAIISPHFSHRVSAEKRNDLYELVTTSTICE